MISNQIIVICGPTASGKTALAVALAQRLGSEVISADSMQIYRTMDIGTAKPTLLEQGGVPHHMLDVADPWEDYSVARYVAQATPIVDRLLALGKTPIVAGGTGLYIDNLVAGRGFAPFSGHHRAALQQRLVAEGIAPLYAQLATVDPHRAARLHLNDEKRILRALEVFLETGETITSHDARTATLPPRYTARTIALTYDSRPALWNAIDRRVDVMMTQGLAQEVENLLAAGVPTTATAMQAIGYKQLVAALAGQGNLAAAVEEVKLRSRQYAKRQLTWFCRNQTANWISWAEKPNFSDGLQKATNYFTEFGIS